MNDTITLTGWCIWCDQPIRYSTSYDEPHWVHTSILATLNCPGITNGQDVTP